LKLFSELRLEFKNNLKELYKAARKGQLVLAKLDCPEAFLPSRGP